MKVLLVTGHSRRSPGAANFGSPDPRDDIYEYQFNLPLVGKVMGHLLESGVKVSMDGYTPMNDVARWNGASDILVEFHANAFNGHATGTEVLYAAVSERGRVAANIMVDHIVGVLGLTRRGARPTKATDRGGYLLWGVRQLALIPEPFFIDNDRDLKVAQEKKDELAKAYADSILQIGREIFDAGN